MKFTNPLRKKSWIRFYSLEPAVTDLYPIKPASNHKRSWVQGERKKSKCPVSGLISTANCPGIKNLMSSGYIVPAPADFKITTNGDGISVNWEAPWLFKMGGDKRSYIGKHDETQVEHKIYIDEIQVEKSEEHTPDIKLDNTLTLRMKYPSLTQFVENNFNPSSEDTLEASMGIIASCIDVVYNQDESWAAADCTKKELNDFIEQLSSKQFKEIETFFETMPKLSHKLKIKNPETKVESEVVLEGLSSFFE